MTHIKQVLERFGEIGEEAKENLYYCEKCKKFSIATKPTEYTNCPCGADFYNINKALSFHTSYLEKQIEWVRGEKRAIPPYREGQENISRDELLVRTAHNSVLQSAIDHLQEELSEIKKL